jgi:hypothetical protein
MDTYYNDSVPSEQEQERKRLIQDTIDRILEYGPDYINALEKLNKSFPIEMTEKNSIRIYK